MSEHRGIVDRLYETFNARRFDALAELLDDDVLLVVNGRSLQGATLVCEELVEAVRLVPAERVALQRIIAETTDTIVTEARYFDASSSATVSRHAAWGAAWRLPITLCEVYRIAGGRIAEWHEYLGTERAVANGRSRAELESLAEEQAALRRVAELVARGAATHEVFDQVTVEAHHLLDTAIALFRYEPSDAAAEVVAESPPEATVGLRVPVEGDNCAAQVWHTRGAARNDDDYQAVAAAGEPRWIKAVVAAPIVVEERLWGALAAGSFSPLPAGTEERLTRFGELVAAAIANAESRAQLAASRARVVASADDARRRLAQDVHDGAQRQLVHTLLFGEQARRALTESDGLAAGLLEQCLGHAQGAYDELRRLARGILPAALEHGGLQTAVQALVADVPISVDCEVLAGRLPDPVEITAYFVIAEALTNVIKHADAGRARVRATCGGDELAVEVSDDGRGDAVPAGASGLVGLADRVGAAGGTISVTSPPGAGTTVAVTLPLAHREDAGDEIRLSHPRTAGRDARISTRDRIDPARRR